MSLKVCITGNTGFIGSSLTQYLHKFPQQFTLLPWNRSNPIEIGDAEAVIHSAGRAHVFREKAADPLREFRSANRDLTLKLAEEAISKGVKTFIFISSISVYGRELKGRLKDDTPLLPDTPYGISKREAEEGLETLFSRQNDCNCVILRLPMIYGPGNKGNMLRLLGMAKRKIPLPLGKATNPRSFLYSQNLSDAIKAILQAQQSPRKQVQTYLLSDGEDLNSARLYETVFQSIHHRAGLWGLHPKVIKLLAEGGEWMEKLLSMSLPLNRRVFSQLFEELSFSSSRFCRDYHWCPPVTPEQGLIKTAQWFMEE